MNDGTFEYDVFLSFCSEDEEVVRPLWQHLTRSGLRVFWSDSSLQDRVGSSWFDVVQESVARSRHMLLICTPASLRSQWVKREYVAFFNHHYAAPHRLLVPLLASGSQVHDLPLFLRELQSIAVDDADSLRTIARILGGPPADDRDGRSLKRGTFHEQEPNHLETLVNRIAAAVHLPPSVVVLIFAIIIAMLALLADRQ